MAEKSFELKPLEPILDTRPTNLVDEGYNFKSVDTKMTAVQMFDENQLQAIDQQCQDAQKTCFTATEKLAGHGLSPNDIRTHTLEVHRAPSAGTLRGASESVGQVVASTEALLRSANQSLPEGSLQAKVMNKSLQRLDEVGCNMDKEFQFLNQACNSLVTKDHAADVAESSAGIYLYLQDVRNQVRELSLMQQQDWADIEKSLDDPKKLSQLRHTLKCDLGDSRQYICAGGLAGIMYNVDRTFTDSQAVEALKEIKPAIDTALNDIALYEMTYNAMTLSNKPVSKVDTQTMKAVHFMKPRLISASRFFSQNRWQKNWDGINEALSDLRVVNDTVLP